MRKVLRVKKTILLVTLYAKTPWNKYIFDINQLPRIVKPLEVTKTYLIKKLQFQ